MKATAVDADQPGDSRTYVLVGQPGEDAFAILSDFARDHDLTAAQITGIGAFAQATVGWFDRQTKAVPADRDRPTMRAAVPYR